MCLPKLSRLKVRKNRQDILTFRQHGSECEFHYLTIIDALYTDYDYFNNSGQLNIIKIYKKYIFWNWTMSKREIIYNIYLRFTNNYIRVLLLSSYLYFILVWYCIDIFKILYGIKKWTIWEVEWTKIIRLRCGAGEDSCVYLE